MANFNPDRFAATVTRISEPKSLDSIAVDQVFHVARELRPYLDKWGVYERIQVKIARLIVERLISPRKVGELIETAIVRQRLPEGSRHRVANPGGFVVASIKNELVRRGIPWSGQED